MTRKHHAHQLEQLEASLRQAGAQERKTLHMNAFDAFIAASKNPYLSFVIPTNNPSDWTPHLQTLKDAFKDHERQPRLEFMRELHPTLVPALEAFGFRLDSVAPVMTLTPDAFSQALAFTQIEYRRLYADEPEDLKAFLQGQTLAYAGDGGDALSWLPQLTAGLRAGTVLVAGVWQGGLCRGRVFKSGVLRGFTSALVSGGLVRNLIMRSSRCKRAFYGRYC